MSKTKIVLFNALIFFGLSLPSLLARKNEVILPPVIRMDIVDAFAVLRKNIDNKALVTLDCRTKNEFASGHVPGAICMDIRAAGLKSRLDKLDRNKSYVIICRSGNRSTRAVKIMLGMGFKHIFHAYEGMKAWLFEDYPIYEGKKPGDRSLLLQYDFEDEEEEDAQEVQVGIGSQEATDFWDGLQ
jgi:rhodanese-related sulfurtransferase